MDVSALVCTLFAAWATYGVCPAEPADLDRATAPIPRGVLVERSVSGEDDVAVDYYVFVPRNARPGAPIFVTVHGSSRNALAQARAFAPVASARGAVLVAPRFRGAEFRDYQRLGRNWKGTRSDRALDRIVTRVGSLTRANTERILIFGYSGGGQFAHRYAMAHPDRVAAAVVASPGWFTFPDEGRWYPYGMRRTPELPGVDFEPEAFLQVPMLVTVGSADVKRSRSLRRSFHVDRQQGRTRVERAERWVAAMEDAAASRGLPSTVELSVLEGMHHSFSENVELGGLATLADTYLFAPRHLARLGTATERVAARDDAPEPTWPIAALAGAPGGPFPTATALAP